MKNIPNMLIALSLCLVLVGCGRPAPPSAQEQLCDDLVELQGALQPLTNVTPGTSIRDVQRDTARLENAWRSLTLAGRELRGIRINEWRALYNQLLRRIQRLPANAPLGEEAANILEDARDLNRLAEESYQQLNCR